MPFMLSGITVALPSIATEFNASARELSLVVISYTTSVSIFLLPLGRLGDIYGRRNILQKGLFLFAVVGLLVPLAWSIESVIILRFIQGLGGAMVSASGMAIVVSVFPVEERGRALGIATASIYLGISCGPFIGGALVTLLGWRSIFYISVPLGLAMYMLVRLRLKSEWAGAKDEGFDWPGTVVYSLLIIFIVVASSKVEERSLWWLFSVAGASLTGLFLYLEMRAKSPLLDLGLLRRNKVFALSSVATLLNYAATFGVTFFLSLYLQYAKGLSPAKTGILLVIQPAFQSIFSPYCGRLSDRYPAERLATYGMAICAVGLGLAALMTPETSLSFIGMVLIVLGIGFALFSSPNTSVILGSVPPRQLGVASGFLATMRTLGMMFSMTIITLLLSIFMGDLAVSVETLPTFIDSMKISFVVFALLCVLGIFCSLGRWSRAK